MAATDRDEDAANTRSSRTEKLWAEVRVDPVEIALPGGVGYTLRAYRLASEVDRPEIDRDRGEQEDDFEAASAAVLRRRRSTSDDEDDNEELADELDEESDEDFDDEDFDDEDFDEDEDEDEEAAADEDEEEAEVDQEVPVFLGKDGKVFLFHSADKLVEFIKSGAEHDLSQIDSWGALVKKVTAKDIVPLEDDIYELDLVVENLRGGSDAWDAPLILRAGEVARDLAFALRIDAVLVSLSSGTPLDELDEALRTAEAGGMKSMFARRKLRKIPAQQSSLAWRTIIGKISAAADWRD